MTVLDFAPAGTSIRAGVATIQLHDDLWRITRSTGEVLGYVQRIDSPAGHKYVAKRMLPRQRRHGPERGARHVGPHRHEPDHPAVP